MAEWFIGPAMEKFIDGCFEYLKDRVSWPTGMEEELQRLRDIRPEIQAVASAYSQAQIESPALNNWFWRLRDAIDEADDVLDDLEHRKLGKQASKNKGKRKADVLEIGQRVLEIAQRAFKIDPNLARLEMAVQKLDQISARVSTFLHLSEGTKQEQEQQQLELHRTRVTGSLVKNDLLGRSKEMESVRRWLRNPQITGAGLYSNISLLSVVGHGGMGKTTLLQHVYKDGATEEFDVKIWVCVSINSNAKTVITNILKSLGKQAPDEEPLEPLQRRLQSEVMSKRFLLVLDDIWEEDERQWEDVLAPLHSGSLGSKILITTRMDSVASTFAKMIKKSKETLLLKGLGEDECLDLLDTHAFAGVENPNVRKRLGSITEEMVKKLSGCPLAAKVIGGIFNFNLDERYWRKVLNCDIGNVEPGQNDLLPILKLSYIYLPKFLQNCFAFCCIFPQDYEFDKDDLVRMWIALGFIQSSNIQGETLEDTGGRYFDILVRKSFFDKFFSPFDFVFYKMHDLLHELARSISTQDCLRVVGDKELSIPQTIRHLSINTPSLETFKRMGEFKNLRSLFLSYNAKCDENFTDVLSNIFKTSKSIRLLCISAPYLEKIPETIDCLIHLRYLRLTCSIFKLPRSLSHLYHLQFMGYRMNLNHCAYDFSPRDINNLHNLRYLSSPLNENCMIYEIGKLKSLQALHCFYVKNDIGYRIGELEHMNELRKINIHQLENIKDVEEACSAKFYDKKNLADLSLQWGNRSGRRKNIVDHDLDEKVLDSIQPHSNNLKRLCIKAYMGVRPAIWMNNVYLISNLEHIELRDCLKLEILPPFGLLPFLKSLHLYNMPEVEQLDHNKDSMFPSLEVLHIENLKALHEWFDKAVAAENGGLLPCLTELRLRDCLKLEELPSLPTKLQKLEMDNIGWKACDWLPGIRSCSKVEIRNLPNIMDLRGRRELVADENSQLVINELVVNDPSVLLMEPLRSLSSLRSLTIEEDDELVSFPSEAEQWLQQHSSSLLKLEFQKLQSLRSLPSSMESLSSLRALLVSNAPQLKLFPKLPSSLERLELRSLQCLPSSFSAISSLTRIKLSNIQRLESLPDLPFSLEKLELEELESLQCLPSSLSAVSSLEYLELRNIPLLRSLPDLPSSLWCLYLEELDKLDCLPSCLPTLSLHVLAIIKASRLVELPDLPGSLELLRIKGCRLQLMERYQNISKVSCRTVKRIANLDYFSGILSDMVSEGLSCVGD